MNDENSQGGSVAEVVEAPAGVIENPVPTIEAPSPISESVPVPDEAVSDIGLVVGAEPTSEQSESDQNQSQPASESIHTDPAQTMVALTAPILAESGQPTDQKGFIHALLVKAQAKIQFNRQKKLEKLIEFAQRRRIITNADVQKLLHVSDRTATRYLVKSVEQGRLVRMGNPRDAKYQFLQ